MRSRKALRPQGSHVHKQRNIVEQRYRLTDCADPFYFIHHQDMLSAVHTFRKVVDDRHLDTPVGGVIRGTEQEHQWEQCDFDMF